MTNKSIQIYETNNMVRPGPGVKHLTEAEAALRLTTLLGQIKAPDEEAKAGAIRRWNSVAKPLNSLGILEEQVICMAAITATAEVHTGKKALVIMCADNGVVEAGVTQTGQEVTAIVAGNMTRGESCACLMAERAAADVFPVDIGLASRPENLGNAHPLWDCNIRRGTKNFLVAPAMTRAETLQAILTGIELVGILKAEGYGIVATGEMGIGNTTTSSAVAAALLHLPAEQVTGRGAGLDKTGLARKIQVIREGLALRKPDKTDGIHVLSQVGGLDLAGMAGLFLGGAIHQIPVVIDGFISAAAAAAAAAICATAKDYMLASHVSAEPAGRLLLQHLGKKPVIQAEMCLGEGTGAVALFPLLDMVLSVYSSMSTFSDIKIAAYEKLI